MRLLIGGAKAKLFHLKDFGDALEKFDIEYMAVHDAEIYDTFPSLNVRNWFGTRTKFKKLINDFKPDAIFADRASHFVLASEDEKIPVFMLLRGDLWSEIKWQAETTMRSSIGKMILWQWKRMNEQCFKNSAMILPICRYLENIVKKKYPDKATEVLYQGIKIENWYPTDGMELRHPCVGLLQDANIWGKTKEMLTLAKVIESMVDVTFYWAGNGVYKDQILSVLGKYKNFKWLGSLQYPIEVRKYLTSVDVYALASGIDMSPLTLQESQLMERPVVATNVGGIPELMQNENTGFLVEKGDHDGWIEKISLLINDKEKAKLIGVDGRNFVKNNFNWNIIAKKFVDILNSYFNGKVL